jgi:hypothetical protein
MVGGLCTGALVGKKAPPQAIASMAVIALAPLAYGVYRLHDFTSDVETYFALNSGKFRQTVADEGLKAMVAMEIKATEENRKIEFVDSMGAPLLPHSMAAQPPAPQPPKFPTCDIALSLATNLKSTIIIGQPGAQKGITAALATRHIKRLNPNMQIWVVDPKADDGESGYFAECDKVLRHHLSPWAKADAIADFISDVEAFLADFEQVEGPKLIIFDEALGVLQKAGKWYSKELMPSLNLLASMGRSSQQYSFIISQSPNASDLGQSGGTRNVFRRVLLVAPNDLGGLGNGTTFVGSPPPDGLVESGKAMFYDSLGDVWGIKQSYAPPQPSPGDLSNTWQRFAAPQIGPPKPMEPVLTPHLPPEPRKTVDEPPTITVLPNPANDPPLLAYLKKKPEGVKRYVLKSQCGAARKMSKKQLQGALDELVESGAVYYCPSTKLYRPAPTP